MLPFIHPGDIPPHDYWNNTQNILLNDTHFVIDYLAEKLNITIYPAMGNHGELHRTNDVTGSLCENNDFHKYCWSGFKYESRIASLFPELERKNYVTQSIVDIYTV